MIVVPGTRVAVGGIADDLKLPTKQKAGPINQEGRFLNGSRKLVRVEVNPFTMICLGANIGACGKVHAVQRRDSKRTVLFFQGASR